MSEYPKMLYIGDKVNYSSRIVHDAEEEAQFRGIGMVDYDDLPEPEPEVIEPEPNDFVTAAQFNAALDRIAALESQVQALLSQSEPSYTAYSSMTSEQLRAELDARNIEYKARDSKAELIALLENADA